MDSKVDRLRRYVVQVAPGDDVESLLEGPAPNFAAGDTEQDQRATEALRHLSQNDELTHEDQLIVEAIVIPDLRPAIDIIDGDFTTDDPTWRHLDTDESLHETIRSTFGSVGRIDLPGHPSLPYGGTGFVVGDDLVMTNRHVAELFTSGLGMTNLRFLPGIGAGIDFIHELGSDASLTLDVRSVKMIHPYWDMALLHVDGLPDRHPSLRLSLEDPDDLIGQDIICVGYPAFDPRNDAEVQNRVFRGVYYVKRLQPGKITGRSSAFSFGKDVRVGTHDSSTLGGNSGSAVIDPKNGAVLALHFAGLYLKENYAVPMCDLAQDKYVVDCGLSFAEAPTPRAGVWDVWWQATTAENVADAGTDSRRFGIGANLDRDSGSATHDRLVIRYNIPIEVTIRVAGDIVTTAATASDPEPAERMVAPYHDSDYRNRAGYAADFLGVDVPLPRPTHAKQLATLANGSPVIPYHHFSIVMDSHRKLPVFTASNVDYSPTKKTPEPGDYTRKGLSGLGPNDTELWFTDPRIPEECQLTDRFFTKDMGAFDRGHIVRREDVSWGSSYREVREAAGDTFHITNCTPQVAGFNRPDSQCNWGDLEVFVAKQSESGRVSIFAGPVLASDDPIFSGVSEHGVVRVQIPRRYWKVAMVVQSARLAAFGFILEQNLDDVGLEFAVTPEWSTRMISLTDLERVAGNLKFPTEIKKADQASTVLGETVRTGVGIELVDPA